MSSYYDDNYGWYDNDDCDPQERHDFYMSVQRRSVTKKCKGCERKVKILPEYAYCNSCADKLERGWDLG